MAAQTHPLEKIVTDAVSGGNQAAIDFTAIIAIITALLPIIGNCLPGNAQKSIAEGDVYSLAACFRAVLAAGYTPREAVAVAIRLRDAAKTANASDVMDLINRARDFR